MRSQVHALFVESRWAGAELHRLATQELSPYCGETERRVRTDGPPVVLEPNTAQTIAISLHELATSAAKIRIAIRSGCRVQIAWSRRRGIWSLSRNTDIDQAAPIKLDL